MEGTGGDFRSFASFWTDRSVLGRSTDHSLVPLRTYALWQVWAAMDSVVYCRRERLSYVVFER